jgi:hypothetical protein
MHLYAGGGLTAGEVVAELVELCETGFCGWWQGPPRRALFEGEYAFYTAVAQDRSAKDLLGDQVLGADRP